MLKLHSNKCGSAEEEIRIKCGFIERSSNCDDCNKDFRGGECLGDHVWCCSQRSSVMTTRRISEVGSALKDIYDLFTKEWRPLCYFRKHFKRKRYLEVHVRNVHKRGFCLM